MKLIAPPKKEESFSLPQNETYVDIDVPIQSLPVDISDVPGSDLHIDDSSVDAETDDKPDEPEP